MAIRGRMWFWVCAVLVLFALFVSLGFARIPAAAQVTIDCADYQADGLHEYDSADGIQPPVAAPEATAFPDEGGSITVFAAASLTRAFEAIANDITESHPDVSLSFNFAGSQALVTQLSEGARADVFASANFAQMKAADEADVLASDPVAFAQNHLVVVVPSDNPAGVESLADLGREGVNVVTALAGVPVGQYTRQVVCAAGTITDQFGESFAEDVARNIVSEEENVTAILTKISLGEGDAGIVYQSYITPELADSVIVIPIDPELNVTATYPMALVRGGNEELGTAFIGYVLGPEGQATLAEFGFLPKPE